MAHKIGWSHNGIHTLCHRAEAPDEGFYTLCGVHIPSDWDTDDGFDEKGVDCIRCVRIEKNDRDDEMANRHLNDVGHF